MSRNTDWNVPAKTSCLGWLEVWKYRKVSPQFNTGSIRNVNKHISKTRFRQRRKITNFAGKHAQLRESSRRKSSKFPRPKFLGLKFVNIISAWHPIDNKYCGILRGPKFCVFSERWIWSDFLALWWRGMFALLTRNKHALRRRLWCYRKWCLDDVAELGKVFEVKRRCHPLAVLMIRFII